MAEEQLVVFRLGHEEYAVSISQVREIIQYKGATKLPNAPSYMEGIINLRGNIIPVIELANRFGLEVQKKSAQYAIIIETPAGEVAILVDEVTEVKRLQDTAIEATPKMMNDEDKHIRGVGKDNDRLLILLDVGKMFDRQEMKMLQDVG